MWIVIIHWHSRFAISRFCCSISLSFIARYHSQTLQLDLILDQRNCSVYRLLPVLSVGRICHHPWSLYQHSAFSLTGMSGSFKSPHSPATSPIPIPPSLTNTQSSTFTSTITVGRLHSTPTPATPITTPTGDAPPSPSELSPSNSGFMTSISTSPTYNPNTLPTSTLSSGTTSTTNLPLSALSLFLLLILVSSSVVLISWLHIYFYHLFCFVCTPAFSFRRQCILLRIALFTLQEKKNNLNLWQIFF